MNEVYIPNDPAGAFQAMEIADFPVSWAGANPWEEGFCFGSETGQLAMTDLTGLQPSFLRNASESGEAVNGVAFSQQWLTVTTRKDINFVGPWLGGKPPGHSVVVSGGARDVIVGPKSGWFIVPLGVDGMMFVKPGFAESDQVLISKPNHAGLSFWRALPLPGDGDSDLIVFPSRRSGVAFTSFREGLHGHTLHNAQFDGLDIVDVCSMDRPDYPLGVIAAGKEGSLVFFNDILHDKDPRILKFKSVRGTVYRVLSASGDVYLLTSKGLFCLFGLADIYSKDVKMKLITNQILRFPIEASDANLVNQRWLLAVGVHDVLKFDCSRLPKSPEQPRIACQNASVNGNAELWEQPTINNAHPTWIESNSQNEKLVNAV